MREGLQTTPAATKEVSINKAIRLEENLARLVLEKRSDILGTLIARRLRPQTFEAIAENEADLLREIGALTPAVRLAIVARVCNATIAEPIHNNIKSRLLSQRPTNITPAVLKAFAEHNEAISHPRTEESDRDVLALAKTVHRKSMPMKGATDWHKIAEIMKERHGIDLTRQQWREYVRNIRDRENAIATSINQ